MLLRNKKQWLRACVELAVILLTCCHSGVTTTNPFVAGITIRDYKQDLAPVAGRGSSMGGESHRSRTGEERVRCYLALLFEPRHLGKEVLFCSAENNGAIVWKRPNFWSVLKITFDWTHWPVLSCLIPMSSRKRRAASSSTSLNWRAEENSLDINKKSRVWRYHHFRWVVQNTFKRPWNTLKTWTMLSGSLFFTSHCSDCPVKSTTVRVKPEWKPQPIP